MSKQPQTGFTLIELMVSVVIGLLVILSIGIVFTESSDNYRQDERMSAVQDNLRFAMAQLTADLEMTGFWTELHDPTDIDVSDASLSISTDCGDTAGWAWVLTEPLEALDNPTAAEANAAFGCIDTGEVVPGQDIIAIKRVLGATTAAGALEDGTTYLETNGTEGQLFRSLSATNTPTTPLTGTVTNWEYHPTIYFIRDYHVTDGDGIPTLCRKYLLGSSSPAFSTECIAPGIERMQFEYGVDSNANGSADRYFTADAVTDMDDVVSVRVMLLARSERPHAAYTNAKTYRMSNAGDYTPADNFYRRTAMSVVQLRNTARLRFVN
ncbi:MAG: PilW family protein [Abyssibacter sp.]|uniref:PilW family protein n=1 Tax=Abyssibacter sp. TaxID=2320200 RepID=UPI00321C16F9